MFLIPEEWESIRYGIGPGINRVVTIGQMIDERYNADVKIGFASDRHLYSIESDDETEETIRKYPVYLYGRINQNIPSFVVRTVNETVSYRIAFNSFVDKIWLTFTEDYIKESYTIWWELKEHIRELDRGNPDDIETTLTDEEKLKEQDEDLCWTAWLGDWVYFPVMYDGYYSIGSAPRNPCSHKNRPVGGG